MKNAMNNNNAAILVTAAGIYCQGLISHKEVIGNKLLLGCQGCYENDEIIVISQDGKVLVSHPFSDKEDIDISQDFWEIVKELEEVQELEGTAALRKLAEVWDSMGYLGFIGVEDASLYVYEGILFNKMYWAYEEALYELRDRCVGHGEDSHINSGENDIDIIVDQFLNEYSPYEDPEWVFFAEMMEEAERMA